MVFGASHAPFERMTATLCPTQPWLRPCCAQWHFGRNSRGRLPEKSLDCRMVGIDGDRTNVSRLVHVCGMDQCKGSGSPSRSSTLADRGLSSSEYQGSKLRRSAAISICPKLLMQGMSSPHSGDLRILNDLFGYVKQHPRCVSLYRFPSRGPNSVAQTDPCRGVLQL